MGGGKEIPDIVGTYQGVLGEELDHRNEVSLKIAFWVLCCLLFCRQVVGKAAYATI